MIDFFKILAVVIAVCLIRVMFGLHNYQVGIDDSNIYFVYVRNFSEGYGFVYTPGGPAVEGFTSFLWTIFLALVFTIRFLPFEQTVMVCCLLLTTGTVFLYYRFIKQRFSPFAAWAITAYILLTPGFIDWNVFSLMDVTLWIFSVSLGVILLLRGNRRALFFGLVMIIPFIRPEGLLVSVLFVVLRIFLDHAAGAGFSRAFRRNLPMLLGVIGCIAAFTGFRLWYFGYPVPNTFYAKVSVSLGSNIRDGVFYFYDTLRHTTLIPAVLLLACVFRVMKGGYWKNWRLHAPVIALLLLIGFFVCYPFLTGGDHFKYARFFQPLFPLIALLFMLIFHQRFAAVQPRMVIATVLTLILLNLDTINDTSFRKSFADAAQGYFQGLRLDLVSHSQLQSEFDIAVNGKHIGQLMNEVLSSCDTLPSFGVVAAGGTGYVYRGRLVDLMGLNNPEMAHADRVKSHGVKNHGSFDKKVFYRQQADMLLSWPDPLTSQMDQPDSSAISFLGRLHDTTYFVNRVLRNIFNDADFNAQYTYARISDGRRHFYSFIKYDAFKSRYPGLQVTRLQPRISPAALLPIQTNP